MIDLPIIPPDLCARDTVRAVHLNNVRYIIHVRVFYIALRTAYSQPRLLCADDASAAKRTTTFLIFSRPLLTSPLPPRVCTVLPRRIRVSPAANAGPRPTVPPRHPRGPVSHLLFSTSTAAAVLSQRRRRGRLVYAAVSPKFALCPCGIL